MAIDFPNSPTTGDIHTVSGKQWQWDSEKWIAYGSSLAPDVLKVDSGNNRVGINQTTPTVALDVTGSARITGDLTVQGTTTTIDSATIAVTDSFTFEGATADAYETTLTVTDPTADRTLTLPDATGTLTVDGAPLASPTFTGTPAAPTASANTSTTQVATTAFVMTEVGDYLPLAGGTLSGAIVAADQVISAPVMKDYAETKAAMAAHDVDLTLGNVQTYTLSGNQTLTFSNPPASGTAGSFTLIVTNGASATLTWPTSVDWAGGTAPTLTASGIDILTFTTVDGGTIWYGFLAGADMK
tara:strand:- start:45 stop:941 length:897 start_codon:yes stop_codon:yes gene_type:complete